MIPNDQPLRKQILTRMLENLDTLEIQELTQWEANFINSVQEQFEKKGDLSDRQCEIVEKLHDKYR